MTLTNQAARKQELIEEIQQLKKDRNAVILAHLYERVDVQDVADFHGDSLGLSQQAAQTDAEVIVFCGVHFMAETAKLLSPQKIVYLANPNAGCPMADMITKEELIQFKAEHPGAPVVAYVNTSAEVKSESDFCCTSANGADVVRYAVEKTGASEILFVPDKHLARTIQKQVPEVKITYWEGFCPTHLRMDPNDVVKLKKEYPDALVFAHPECDDPMKEMADMIGSTTAIVKAAKASDNNTFIICTEDGVSRRLAEDCPDKLFITPTRASAVCPNMKLTKLENIRKSLLGDVPEMIIPEEIAVPARRCLDAMMAVPASGIKVLQTPSPASVA
ncbi:MAG: quinolinate synthase NadA [Vampirovibrio sp.]|nr:quinolinate synthase NadA [Vampirovibrio sp.]